MCPCFDIRTFSFLVRRGCGGQTRHLEEALPALQLPGGQEDTHLAVLRKQVCSGLGMACVVVVVVVATTTVVVAAAVVTAAVVVAVTAATVVVVAATAATVVGAVAAVAVPVVVKGVSGFCCCGLCCCYHFSHSCCFCCHCCCSDNAFNAPIVTTNRHIRFDTVIGEIQASHEHRLDLTAGLRAKKCSVASSHHGAAAAAVREKNKTQQFDMENNIIILS